MRHMPFLTLAFACLLGVSAPPSLAASGGERDCADRVDNDGDTVTDCADSDCATAAACQPDGKPEITDERCSDWIDNDEDGYVDCEDEACSTAGIKVCLGSWDLHDDGDDKAKPAPPTGTLDASGDGFSVTSILGQGDDRDGERSDRYCSDGLDNDGDGKTDCEDLGCRLAPDVLVCRGSSNMNFSIVTAVAQTYDLETQAPDTRFSKLQVRSLGSIPMIQDSFYLVSMRMEKTPRLTFALFQIPVAKGHMLNINSGGGGLTDEVVISTGKQLLLEPAFYMVNAFQQGNGAAVELSGPVSLVSEGRLAYRVYAAGGSGRSSGNVGGRYFSFDNERYTWSVGGSLTWDIIGYHDRWDSQFILHPSPTALEVRVGAKYDQRAQERYPALNARLVAKHGRGVFTAETYLKYEQEFGSTQTAFNVKGGVLVWPERLMVAADFGQVLATPYETLPDELETDIRKIRDERQWRVAIHYFFWSNIGVASLVYKDRWLDTSLNGEPEEQQRELGLVGQFRF